LVMYTLPLFPPTTAATLTPTYTLPALTLTLSPTRRSNSGFVICGRSIRFRLCFCFCFWFRLCLCFRLCFGSIIFEI
jgi:hypothetical protein